jgi:hypothetical protein
MMYGVAGFHPCDGPGEGRVRPKLGIMEAQKEGWITRGRERYRACGSAEMAKVRDCGRIEGVRIERQVAGVRSNC